MKKAKIKIIIVLVLFFILVSSHIFNTGKGHVGVVKDNIALTDKVDGLTKENNGLKKQVTTLETKVSDLKSLNTKFETTQEITNEKKDVVENTKPKLKGKSNEKSTVTNNNDANSGFSINAISDPEGD
jgi:uncharacterized protein YlxW (UPF0749 family)